MLRISAQLAIHTASQIRFDQKNKLCTVQSFTRLPLPCEPTALHVEAASRLHAA